MINTNPVVFVGTKNGNSWNFLMMFIVAKIHARTEVLRVSDTISKFKIRKWIPHISTSRSPND